jgi:hypothetical protein
MATIQPRPGFDPLRINWGGPDEPRTDRCSYCGDLFPEDDEADFIPLIMWNHAGWCAEFCDHCQAAWFGIETFPEPPADDPGDAGDAPDLGPCCLCGRADGVRNMIMLDRRCAVPGHGWGCVVCGLPNDGASAVVCDPCLDRWRADNSILMTACRGYPATDGRIAIAELPEGVFDHDPTVDHG